MIHAETRVTNPPEAVFIFASSTVFWKASKVRKRGLPIFRLAFALRKNGRTRRLWRLVMAGRD